MPEYMLLGYIPREGGPAPGQRAALQAEWVRFDRALRDAGIHLARHRLSPPEETTTVRVREDETLITDGPYADTKEYFASGFLIQVADLDTALKWAARMPNSTIGSVEVRPVRGEGNR